MIVAVDAGGDTCPLFGVGRFLYSDLQPLTELGIPPDPHPEGPSSLPAEAPADIQEELASDRRREGLRKAAVVTRLPRLIQVDMSRFYLICVVQYSLARSTLYVLRYSLL